MISRDHVRSRYGLIPDKESVTVCLVRDGGNTEIEINDAAWRKPVNEARLLAEGIAINGTEEEWHVPDAVLNPAGNGRRILPEDRIVTADRPAEVYGVLRARLMTLRTVWVCICQKVRS